MQTHGIPQYFGVYYALGIALILEGFMSSFYHICPSNANFQFGESQLKWTIPVNIHRGVTLIYR